MHGPVLVSWLLALLTAAAGGYCLTRLRRSPCTDGPATGRLHAYESDAAEALMGFGMAVMAVSGSAVPAAVWAWVFGAPAVAFLLASASGPARRAHRLHHAIGGLAMTYMALAMGSAPGHGHHHAASTGTPLLTGALLLYFGGYSLWAGTRLLAAPAGRPAVGPGGTAVAVAGPTAVTAGLPRACRLSMGIGMFAMLLTM
ncbi:DUF5134 domain-containing protein [Streptomyces sp. CB01881]|uniref:DUF5134 domain-containing protein n=1 Tax=Streptomyces sp. CB01881 TaxID=2078691 RepID=UPI000CDC371D|nr:DUF5134 domain-containing protein [Streptomyces sp. CB01881]AUY48724.1 DUF5134 domain-containing protein [Streptomyces sp. CB01881]TYC77214.1 DUF5134 domain-containing protein [Streptomyces sp. CB01881]